MTSSMPRKRSFRIVIAILIAILLMPVGPLLDRTSSSGAAVLGLYTLRYALLFVGYGIGLLSLVVLAVTAPDVIERRITIGVRWLRSRVVLLLVLIYGCIELWYAVRRVLVRTGFFYDAKPVRLAGIVPVDGQFTLILWSLGLLLLWGIGVMLFAGHTADAEGRAALGNFVMGVLSSGLAFIIFLYGYALVIRGENYHQQHEFWTSFHHLDPDLVYRMDADVQDYPMDVRQFDTSIHISTNSQGFRADRDFGPGEIAVLGDSFIFGLLIDQPDVWSNSLEEKLGRPVSNYGTTGYALWQYNEVVAQVVAANNPSLVIYGVFANDLVDASIEAQNVRLAQRLRFRPWMNPPSYTIYRLLYESPGYYVWRAFTGKTQETEPDLTPLPNGLEPSCAPREQGYLSRVGGYLQDELDQAIELADAHDYQLVVLGLPSRESVYLDELTPVCRQSLTAEVSVEGRGLASMCEYLHERDIPCYDMTVDFVDEANSRDDLIYFAWDGHWNEAGHEVFASLLADYLESEGLLP